MVARRAESRGELESLIRVRMADRSGEETQHGNGEEHGENGASNECNEHRDLRGRFLEYV
jgi:hypothetical protein